MHEWYLRELYLNNRLIRPDALSVAGLPSTLFPVTCAPRRIRRAPIFRAIFFVWPLFAAKLSFCCTR